MTFSVDMTDQEEDGSDLPSSIEKSEKTQGELTIMERRDISPESRESRKNLKESGSTTTPSRMSSKMLKIFGKMSRHSLTQRVHSTSKRSRLMLP